jgi:hypothetical protein
LKRINDQQHLCFNLYLKEFSIRNVREMANVGLLKRVLVLSDDKNIICCTYVESIFTAVGFIHAVGSFKLFQVGVNT